MAGKHIALTEDIGHIMLLDEVLTMSARMAAATGDFSYETRYDLFDPQLTVEIDEVRVLLSHTEIALFVGETDEANLALVKLERQAFALAHQGRRQQATALLLSDEYLSLKKIYAGGMEKTVHAATGLIEQETRQLRSLSLWLAVANVVGILSLLVAWFFAARSARSWAAERGETEDALREAHEQLEVRVAQRTAELLNTNAELKHEVDERALAEAKIRRLSQLYNLLSQCNQAVVRCTDEGELFAQVCRAAVQCGGFKMAWIGLVDEASQRVVPLACYGEGVEYLDDLQLSVDGGSPFGRGLTGTSLRENRPYWCQDFMRDPFTAPWQESGARFGWGSAAALPLRRNGVAIGAFRLYSGAVNAFDEAARKLLVEMAESISFALHNFAHEAQRKKAETSLAESEQHFRAVTESASDAMLTADSSGHITGWNAAAQRLFGYTGADIIGQSLTVLMPERFRNPHRAGLARVAAGGVPHVIGKTVELAGLRQGGSKFPLELSLGQWRTADGLFFSAIVRDISERKQAEAAVRQLNAELESKVLARTAELEHARLEAEQANRAKSAFLATMSHEIRTPMNGVIGMIDVLQQTSLRGPQIEMSNIIHDSAFALLAIIDDILDFSKIEAGKFQVDCVTMDVADVVEGVCDTLARVAENKAVELTLFTDPTIPAAVLGDPARLRQVLVNLAGNAIKFSSGQDSQGKVSVRALLVASTPDEHGRFPLLNPLEIPSPQSSPASGRGGEREKQLSISESLRDVKQILLEFRILDNGIGIDQEAQARLFTPFTQADSSTTRSFGGTGLGLAISGQLVNMMGGEITLNSELGKGSLFSVRMPFDLPQEQLDAGRDQLNSPAKPSLPPARGKARMGVSTAEDSVSTRSLALRGDLVAGLSCLVVGDAASLSDDFAAYLVHGGASVERVPDVVSAQEWITRQWIASHLPGLCVVVIDTAGVNPPLDELRAAVRTQPGLDGRFVIVGRGGRRWGHVEEAGLVMLDADGMRRSRFLEAVAIAAGRAQEYDTSNQSGADEVTVKPPTREETRQQGHLILIAEDNEINQKVIQKQLALLGQASDIANNGREALQRWQSGDYGILLTDLHMPVMDGCQLTAAIRAAESGKARIPIIAFTANALKGEAEHCLEVGMDDYLSKPVRLADLQAMLEKWLPVVAEEQRESSVSTPSLALPLQGGGNVVVDVNVNVLKALLGDDEATIREFLHDFRLGAEKIAAELRTVYADGKTAETGALAHKLKSSARSVGALALGELCAEMEQAGKADDTEALAVLLPQFEQELAGVESFLAGY